MFPSTEEQMKSLLVTLLYAYYLIGFRGKQNQK